MNLSEIINFLQEKIKIENHFDNFNSTKNKFFVCTHDIWSLDGLIIILFYLKKLEKKNKLYIVGWISKPTALKEKLSFFYKKLLNIEFINVRYSKNNVEKISNILNNEPKSNVIMFVERRKFETSSGLYNIYNSIKNNNVDIVNISLLDGTINPIVWKGHKKNTSIRTIHKFLSNDWTLTSRKFEPFEYRDKDDFMKKYYKLLYLQ